MALTLPGRRNVRTACGQVPSSTGNLSGGWWEKPRGDLFPTAALTCIRHVRELLSATRGKGTFNRQCENEKGRREVHLSACCNLLLPSNRPAGPRGKGRIRWSYLDQTGGNSCMCMPQEKRFFFISRSSLSLGRGVWRSFRSGRVPSHHTGGGASRVRRSSRCHPSLRG